MRTINKEYIIHSNNNFNILHVFKRTYNIYEHKLLYLSSMNGCLSKLYNTASTISTLACASSSNV